MGQGIAPNYTLSQALAAYNGDQVMTQTMYYIEAVNTKEPDLEHMQIYGQGFELPERTNETADVSYRAYPIPVPTTLKMGQDHNITLNCDVHQKLRRGFLNWQARAIDPRITLQTESFAADRRPTAGVGASGLRLFLLAPDMKTSEMIVRIYGVRVISVGSLALSNTDGGVATFQVGFKSVYWEIDTQVASDNAIMEVYGEVDTESPQPYGADYESAAMTGLGDVQTVMG